MSEKMSNAPVYYALAQVQFNPVAAMAKYVDDVQDHLRQLGYTLFEPQQLMHLQFFTAPGQSQAEPKVAQISSWLMTKGDQTSGFVLSPSSLTFHTTHYETNREFISQLLLGLKAVHKAVKLDHISRLGLRYLDAILPHPGESVDLYLVDGLHGVRFDAKQKYALNESVFETKSGPVLPIGTLIARSYRMDAPLGYPPDINPNGLVLMPKFHIDKALLHVVIDTDHFVEGQMPIEFEKIEEQLVELHSTIKLVFNATITEHAQNIWA